MKKHLLKSLLFLLPALLVLYFFFDPGQYKLFPKCLFYTTTGMYCPGCGSQRAVHNLLHLNIQEAFKNNLLIFPAGIVILYNYIHPLINSFFHSNLPDILRHRTTPWFILGAILLYWVIRNL